MLLSDGISSEIRVGQNLATVGDTYGIVDRPLRDACHRSRVVPAADRVPNTARVTLGLRPGLERGLRKPKPF